MKLGEGKFSVGTYIFTRDKISNLILQSLRSICNIHKPDMNGVCTDLDFTSEKPALLPVPTRHFRRFEHHASMHQP